MTDFRLGDKSVHLIGDPHLGKNFDLHCPRHRKGERATHQMAQFNDELHTGADVTVMVGDLFDVPTVPPAVIVGAAQAMLLAAETYPDSLFVAMAGNHDISRNLSKVGAWTEFTRILENRYENLIVLRRPAVLSNIAFFPWEWDRSAEEQVGDLAGMSAGAAIGHWDLELFDGDGAHMVPVEALRAAFGSEVQLYSGHFHTPGRYGDVICTGSMQPVSHGEDPDETFYVTRPLDEVLANPEAYRNKHVRVVVKPGEEIPEIDCLGLTHIRAREEDENGVAVVSPGDFDWIDRLRSRIHGLAPHVRQFIVERMPDVDPEKQRGGSPSPAEPGSEDGGSCKASV